MRKLIIWKLINVINMKADYIHRRMYFLEYVIVKSEQT